MPIYRIGDMWQVFDKADLFFITTNAIVNKDGELVMGKGIAGEAKKRFPWLPMTWGKIIKDIPDGKYGILLFPSWNDKPKVFSKLAAFQTKYDWRKPSPLDLVAYSIGMLHQCAEMNPNKSIHLPFPGIGNGGLNPFNVKPLLDMLPENVTIWRDK